MRCEYECGQTPEVETKMSPLPGPNHQQTNDLKRKQIEPITPIWVSSLITNICALGHFFDREVRRSIY
jgi:hypothetical protein